MKRKNPQSKFGVSCYYFIAPEIISNFNVSNMFYEYSNLSMEWEWKEILMEN